MKQIFLIFLIGLMLTSCNSADSQTIEATITQTETASAPTQTQTLPSTITDTPTSTATDTPTITLSPTLTITPTVTYTPGPTSTKTLTPKPSETSTPTKVTILTSGKITIETIFYDGTAGDKEPDEYVQIRNDDKSPIQLKGWSLSDDADHTFFFPSYTIQPGEFCRIYTNEDHPETCGFNYAFSGSAIWNNGGDTATLRDSTGLVIDTYSYK